MRVTIHETGDPTFIHTQDELDHVILSASAQARSSERINIIFLKADNDNEMSLAVGDNDTVLTFVYGHNNPPYYASKGISSYDTPVFTGYIALEHHTEYPRKWVIPLSQGLSAVHEFLRSGDLPKGINWEQT